MTFFVQPAAAWRPHSNPPVKACVPRPAEIRPSWEDLAAEERWAEAVLAYLRTNRRKLFPLWTVINAIVAESCQRSRFDVRAATFEALQEVMRLRRERLIFRHKREWIGILDVGVPVIPLEALPGRLFAEPARPLANES